MTLLPPVMAGRERFTAHFIADILSRQDTRERRGRERLEGQERYRLEGERQMIEGHERLGGQEKERGQKRERPVGEERQDLGKMREAPLNLVVGRREEREEPRRKKMRTTFTGRQIFELERMFETKKYLNSSERSHLSR